MSINLIVQVADNNCKLTAEKLLEWGQSPLPCSPSSLSGKAPASNGILIKHTEYQKRQPTPQEIDEWFTNPKNGVGVLCGIRGFYIIDFDIEKLDKDGKLSGKGFEDSSACKSFATMLSNDYPQLKRWMDITPSGGVHIAVRLKCKPEFTNFTHNDYSEFQQDLVRTGNGTEKYSEARQLGEILGEGRYCIISPTKKYHSVKFPDNFEDIPEFASIEELGFIKYEKKTKQNLEAKTEKKTETKTEKKTEKKTETKTDKVVPIREEINLETFYAISKLISRKAQNIFNNQAESSDRSKELATFIQEVYGWANWLSSKGYQYLESPEDLLNQCGLSLGLDTDKIQRIRNTVNVVVCLPALHYVKGDKGCENRLKEATREFNCVTTTVEDTIYQDLFGSGDADFVVFDSVFYKYTGEGYWQSLDDEYVQKLIVNKLPELFKYREVKKVLLKEFKFATEANKVASFKYNRTNLMIPNTQQKKSYRCFSDCTVDMSTGEKLEHSREHFLTSRINYPYIVNSPIPQVFQDFLGNSYGVEQIELIRAGIAMYIDPTEHYEKFFYCLGEQGSGKGTLIDLITHLVGEQSVSGIAKLSYLSNPEKCHQFLSGKSLIFNEDLVGYQSELGGLMSLTQNLKHPGRALFSSNAYLKEWNVRFLLGGIDIVQIERSCDGWDRRCIPIQTKGSIQKKDIGLREKLRKVSAEIISWALALPKETRQQLLFNNTSLAIESLKLKHQVDSEPTKSFIDQCLMPGGVNTVSNDELYSWYKSYAKHAGIKKQLNLNNFLKEIEKSIPMCRVKRSQLKNRTWIPAHWINIRQESFNGTGDDCICHKTSEGYLDMFLHPERYRDDEGEQIPVETTSKAVGEPLIEKPKIEFNFVSVSEGVRNLWNSPDLGKYLHYIGMVDFNEYLLSANLSEAQRQYIDKAKNEYSPNTVAGF